MTFSENILYRLSNSWPDYMKSKRSQYGGGDVINEEFHLNYSIRQQFDRKVRDGINLDIRNKNILEIGCGHGGISIFMALNGAKQVVGIDLNTYNMEIGRKLKQRIEEELGIVKSLNVEFIEMNAYEMSFQPASFDLVIADNVFEHFMEPKKVMEQSNAVLRKGGKLVVPLFSSIYSKYALHLKHGLKVPWANLFFSEKTIVNVLKQICEDKPEMGLIYPGVYNNPKKVRDLRKYGDLNDITYASFKKMANESGFQVESFNVKPTPVIIGKMVSRIPLLKKSIAVDIFSQGAGAILTKI